MVIYATIKQLAEQYQVTYNTVQLIVAEMYREKKDGIVYIGRFPRIDVDKFREYLIERKEEGK